jgi:hypothetical protein
VPVPLPGPAAPPRIPMLRHRPSLAGRSSPTC